MARIELKNITVKYVGEDNRPKPPALDNVNLVIEEGETLSVVGPSGCGKSTLLKIVAGLEYPDQGQVFYNGYDVTRVEPQKRGVGMVFQDYALYPTMKGQGNLQYFFEVHQRTPEEMEQRVREVAALMGVGFEMLLGQVPVTLSGGEQQRVAIARCIVRDPSIFLMDEPICNLDAKLRERTRIEMKKLLRRFSVSTLYVTHDQQEAIFMGDRIAVLRQGKVEQVGTFEELYYTPENLFVARFIGAPPMNILDVSCDGQTIRLADGQMLAIPHEVAVSLPKGNFRLGVRPESWDLDRAEGIVAQVRHIERIPTEQAAFVHGALQHTPLTALAPLEYTSSSTVTLLPRWDQVYLFDPHSEQSIHVPDIPDLF